MNIPPAETAKEQSNKNLIENYSFFIENAIKDAISEGKCMVILPSKLEIIPLELTDVLREKGYRFSAFGDKTYINWYH
jgi:hypothetical protein